MTTGPWIFQADLPLFIEMWDGMVQKIGLDLKHYHKDQRVESVMIEVNRSFYASPSDFKRVQSDLTHAIMQAATIGPYNDPWRII